MRQWNQSKFGGAALAWGICAGAALYQPTAARSAGEDGANNPPTGQTFGGQNNSGQQPMRPEEMMTQQLNLTPRQQAAAQAIF